MRSYVLVAILSFLTLAPPAAAQLPQSQIALIDAELFGVDRSHSLLDFSVRFMNMSTVRGTFNDYEAAIVYDEEDLTRTSVTLVIDVASIDTASEWRDRDLQSERFFDAENHPRLVFQSDRISETETGFVAHGRLTMRGVTREIEVPFERTLLRTADSGWGNLRIGFAGRITLSRTDYGIHGGDFWGIEAVSDEVEIEFGLLGTVMNMERITFRSRNKPSIGEVLQEVVAEEGIEAAAARYRDLKAEHPDDYNFAESELNHLGYKLLQRGLTAEATRILELNAEAYPESANVYDSLGHVYAVSGDRAKALAHYDRALAIDPHYPSAIEMKRRLDS